MKRITIGRNPNCDIVLDDMMVSRNHALLTIERGRYTLVSMGSNGTKVNGSLIPNGKEILVKRGDTIIFSGISQLDWNEVPDPMRIWRKALIIVICFIGLFAMIGLGYWLWNTNSRSYSDLSDINYSVETIDSISEKKIVEDRKDSVLGNKDLKNIFFPSEKEGEKAKSKEITKTKECSKSKKKEPDTENTTTAEKKEPKTEEANEWIY